METLANERWERKKGGGFSFGLGAFADFKTLATTLRKTVASANISHIDSGHFEKIIDDFASMVGEEEFYLRVGGILQTKSAFLGHVTHDPAHEHIEARQRIDSQVEEYSKSYDHSFDLPIGALLTVLDAVKQQIFDDALDKGLSTQDAVQIVKDSETALQEAFHVAETTEVTLRNIDEHETSAIQDKIVEVPDDAPATVKRRAERENLDILSSSVRNTAQQKVRVLDQQIAIVEAKKTEISSKLRQTPGVKETVTTVFSSLIDGLKTVRDGCMYVVRNPMETIEHTYDVTTTLGGKAVNTVSETGRFVWNNPSEALDLATSELSSMYSAAKDDVFGTSLNLAEYVLVVLGH